MSATAADLLAALRREGLLVEAAAAPEPAGLADDSRSVHPGQWFVAVRGSQADGHRFIPGALERGAAALVVERPDATAAAPQVVVTDGRRAALALARAWNGDPAAALTLVGITGTNGKTTTTALVRHLLNAAGNAGSIGTLGAFDGRGEAVPSTAGNLTTPGAVDLQATLAAMRERGVRHVAMETSSHSLDQGRLDGLAFAAGVFTNVSRDHLDYHGSMEDYLAAKLRLAALLAPGAAAVVNADDPAWDAIPGDIPRLTFGVGGAADLRAEDLVLDAAGSRFRLAGRFGSAEVVLPLLGDFNVANALGAAGAAVALGRPPRPPHRAHVEVAEEGERRLAAGEPEAAPRCVEHQVLGPQVRGPSHAEREWGMSPRGSHPTRDRPRSRQRHAPSTRGSRGGRG